MLSPYFLIKIGLELFNGIIYNGALCLTRYFNRNQLINYVPKQEIIGLTIQDAILDTLVPWNGKGKLLKLLQLSEDNLSCFPSLIIALRA